MDEPPIFLNHDPASLLNGRYQLLKRLGTGGAGVVSKAADFDQDQKVIAIKILSPRDLGDPTLLPRFHNELLLMRDCRHENIVEVYDFGTTETGQYFITMEFVDGGSLYDRIHSKLPRLPFPETLRILLDVARGLAQVHSRDVVHRDMKPANILLAQSGLAKVTDFGLARDTTSGNTLTKSDNTLGTPEYMAPEQFSSHRVDWHADIYSYGIIAYEMAVWKRPFTAASYDEWARAHRYQPTPRFATRESGIPRWFEAFVFGCTEKKPENRYESMDDIIRLLEERMWRMGLLKTKPPKIGSWWSQIGSRIAYKLMGFD